MESTILRASPIHSGVGLAALVVLFASTTFADTLDQFHIVPPGTTSILASRVGSEFDQSQTFTVGLAGRISRIELGVYRPYNTTADLLFDLWPTDASGAPVLQSDASLFSVSIAANQIPSYDDINFLQPFASLNVDVLAANIEGHVGDKFAIVLRSAGDYNWWLSSDDVVDSYPSGGAYYRASGSGPWSNDDSASFFRDKYFREFVIPEPASLVLYCIGVALMGSAGWRRR